MSQPPSYGDSAAYPPQGPPPAGLGVPGMYPPGQQGGGYPPQGGMYPPQGGMYPPQGGAAQGRKGFSRIYYFVSLMVHFVV